MYNKSIPPVGAAQKVQAGTGFSARRQSAQDETPDKALKQSAESVQVTLSPQAASGEAQLESAKTQVERLMKMMEDTNGKIRRAVEQAAPKEIKAKAVPSAIGLQLRTAIAKLQHAGLKIKGVAQEYSPRVPAGHVVTQVPGPGSAVDEQVGVRLIISRGPPPEKEKYDRTRRKEELAIRTRDRENDSGSRQEKTAVTMPPSVSADARAAAPPEACGDSEADE